MNEEPLVSVVRGTPTPEEAAALVAALLSRSTSADPRPASGAWIKSARPGAGRASWRESGLPR